MPAPARPSSRLLNAYRQAAGVSPRASYYLVGNATGQELQPPATAGSDRSTWASSPRRRPAARSASIPAPASIVPSNANGFTSFQTRVLGHREQSRGGVLVLLDPPADQPDLGVLPAPSRSCSSTRPLRGVTMVQANNDLGSGWASPTGLANQAINSSSPFMLLVGGRRSRRWRRRPSIRRSPASRRPAQSLYGLAMAGDLATLWSLVEGGLHHAAEHGVRSGERGRNIFLEAVWNSFVICERPSHAAARRQRWRRRHLAADALVPDRASGWRRPASIPAMPPAAARPTSRPIPAATCSTPRRNGDFVRDRAATRAPARPRRCGRR